MISEQKFPWFVLSKGQEKKWLCVCFHNQCMFEICFNFIFRISRTLIYFFNSAVGVTEKNSERHNKCNSAKSEFKM